MNMPTSLEIIRKTAFFELSGLKEVIGDLQARNGQKASECGTS
jgi:hypothetical protein